MNILNLLYSTATNEERGNLTHNLEEMYLEQLRGLYKERSKIDEQISWYKSKLDEVDLFKKRYGL